MSKEILHIYTRVSSLVQSEEGTSLETQKLGGIRKAAELGYDHQVWNEGGKSSHSSEIEDRPVLFDLLSEVEKGNINHLYVYNTDRLSRNDRTWSIIRWKLKSNDVVVHTTSGRIDLSNPIDDLMMGLLSEISQYDNKIRMDRSRRGKLYKVQQGFFRGGPTPFGYTNEKKRLVEDPEESKWVRFMYKAYSEGKSVNEIRRTLNDNNVITRRGNPYWSLGSINKILRNSTYVGWYEYTDKKLEETVRVETPPIVERPIWDAVQNRINRFLERKHQINRSKHSYLLRDFMFCGHCGSKMSGRRGPNNHFYYCPKKERSWTTDPDYQPNWERGKGCGLVRSLNIQRTDTIVWDVVLNLVRESKTLREEYRQNFLQSVTESRQKAKSLDKKLSKRKKRFQIELKELEETIAGFEASVLLKRFSGDPVIIRNRLESELTSVKEKLEAVDLDEKRIEDEQRWINWLDRFESDIDSKEEYSEEERKEYLSGILRKIVVHYNEESNDHSLEIEFEVPIVDDRLIYNNPERRKEGWVVDSGQTRFVLDSLPISKGGRPRKSKSA
jgi:DNA invertase Pin-like site-specific DNA recombinase